MTLDAPLYLGPMPQGRAMTTVDERVVRAPLARIFSLAADVERWPALLPHYRFVRFLERRRDGGGVVDMSAYRPFGVLRWPTWWRSRMRVDAPQSAARPAVRFTHVGGVTRGMEVEWTFEAMSNDTFVRIVHVWDGPPVPVVGTFAATALIGPVFVHGIASRTLAGLAAVAERGVG
ncbi:MAG TPA: SRPBCC family protein [Gemmatimonadaceae bacterium]|jgi:ribosome-associated toxin RatA of RatAB toxin-antitoxin module